MSRFTYENQGSKKFLIYHLDENEILDTMALGMMTYNKIPNLLPVSFTQIDAERYLRYSGLSLSTLKSQLAGTIKKERLLSVFDSICKGIRSSEEYLLDGNSFVLDAENIYIDTANNKTNLVYLPILGREETTDYVIFFKGIVTNVITDPSEDGTYISKLLNYLNATENFSLVEFERLIYQLRTASAREQHKEPVNKGSGPQRTPVKPAAKPEDQGHRETVRLSAPPKDNRDISPAVPDTKKKDVPEPENKDIPEKNKKKEDEYSFEIPGKPREKKAAQKNTDEKKPESAPEKNMSMLDLLRNFSGENLELYKQQNNKDKQKGEKKNKKKEKEDINVKIEEKHPDKKASNEPVLTISSMDARHPLFFTVDKDEFRIGRRDTNDAVIRGFDSVSREHCMIIKEHGRYYVIDTSKYGTRVDGEVCIKGQKGNALHDQSVIEFPEISFRVEFR